MDLTGKVISVLEAQRFAGRNGEIVKHGFVVETGGLYPKKVKFDVIGEDKWNRLSMPLVVGSDVQVFFDVESRQWKDSWFTSCNCYRVMASGAQQQQASAQPAPKPAPAPSSASAGGDLPF